MSRDPLQCSELVLSLQASLEPDDEVEIIMDRRRTGDLFESESRGQERLPADRRCNTDLDLEVRTKGFAIVPGAAMTPRPREEPDAEDRARFENILSFRRRREPRPGRAVGAASTVMAALILAPPLSVLPDRIPGAAPTEEFAKHEPSGPAPRIGRGEPSGSAPARASNPFETRATAAQKPRAPRPSSKHGAIEGYAARVRVATGRAVSKARGLIDRLKSEVIGNTPMLTGPEPPADEAPVGTKRRPADSL